jgi:rubrerythrin
MKKPTSIGLNRTGMATAPRQGKDMLTQPVAATAGVAPDGQGVAEIREAYAKESEVFGTVPPPASLKNVAATALETLKGHKATVLLDRLGQRLAFERTGVRLYQAIIAKVEAHGETEGGPPLAELRQICDEELAHFVMVQDAIERLGADPTAMTPAADADAMASAGLIQVATDPRIDVDHSLCAILTAELVDHDGWETLIDLCEALGRDELVADFRRALADEANHLLLVRKWVSGRTAVEAGVEEEVQSPAP